MPEASTYTIAGKQLQCNHCNSNLFLYEQARVDRAVLGGLMHLEGMFAHHADLYICNTCGHSHWFFAKGKSRSDFNSSSSAEDCLNCGKLIAKDSDNCNNCGWSWNSN